MENMEKPEIKDCRTCKFVSHHETKKNSTNYGKCSYTKLLLLAVQANCKYFQKSI